MKSITYSFTQNFAVSHYGSPTIKTSLYQVPFTKTITTLNIRVNSFTHRAHVKNEQITFTIAGDDGLRFLSLACEERYIGDDK